MKFTNHYKHLCLLLLWGCLGLFSCTSTKNIPYFRNVPDTLQGQNIIVPTSAFQEPRIQSNDLLQVTIQTLDPQTNSAINATLASTSAQPMVTQGFMVDKEGCIEIPMVGRIFVNNITTSEAREAIRKKAVIYYKDPVVNVRFLNFTVSVLGEVTRPGVYNIVNEKATVLDAISMAGDLTIFAKRKNIMLVRELNGKKQISRLDLTSTDLFQSTSLYLKQGDMIYIEPNKSKIASNDQAQIRNVTIASTLITSLALIISRINIK